MIFNSFEFIVFFPTVIFVYFIIPQKVRYIWLLLVSYYFYMSWNVKYASLLLLSTFVTWGFGNVLQYVEDNEVDVFKKYRKKKLCVVTSFIINLGMLFFFKYFEFVLENINKCLKSFKLQEINIGVDIVLPMGISFFVFQALSYIVDVYRNEIYAEKNFFKYALFISFFPQLVAGPIERSKNLLVQIGNIEEINVWDLDRVRDGLLLMLWGFFQKMVLADRAAIVVDYVFEFYIEYGFLELMTTAILFSWQIYCDFGGYSNIAIGAALVMGFKLMQNFRQPYFAINLKDFWRRWHISLTTWFTDYLYIPLGGNRKGKKRQYFNILIVYLCSGIWHGANWTYILWGVFHGIAQILGNAYDICFLPKNNYLKKIQRVFKSCCTFGVVTIFWVMFRVKNLSDFVGYFNQMFHYKRLHSFVDMGMSAANWYILMGAIIIVITVDYIHERNFKIREWIYKKNILIRGAIYLCAIWIIVLFGVYGFEYDASQFIYFQF